ncbi:capsule biosynthesis protein [Sphingobium sp. SCG-1]|uniref:capsular polysaccharide export protein, LipB/KpsS family n=1 Tax=Sphingobium sp. SCG-1 TaxID=2072936 RepID=UPI000CD69D6A|nr:capsule biosynthesis protein [Sphingobium sp. SCG-1]AUW58712.1 capsule biosynthesis protein [Sphingobium sp. SCG-1]
MTDFLRVPPFPGSKPVKFSQPGASAEDPEAIIALLKTHRVGGSFWGSQPPIAPETIVACPWDRSSALAMAKRAAGCETPVLFWIIDPRVGDVPYATWRGQADPWHFASRAQVLWGRSDDERLMIARIAGCATELMDDRECPSLRDQIVSSVLQHSYIDPFSAEPTTAAKIIELLGYWRSLIDANRPIRAAAGMAFWKRETVDPLLWGGGETVQHISTVRALQALPADAAVAVWKAKTPPELLAAIEARAVGNPALLHEVEDGFIRSIGLGADCVPPLSITVDSVGVHFDPAKESGLERILNSADFAPEEIERAEAIRALILSSGLSKYGVGSEAMARPGGDKRHVLVTGQVEDDRSVLAARGEVQGNLDLLRRARAAEPDAFLIYRPHPDVDAGHRKGHVPDDSALRYADAIDRGTPISSLLDMVDGVHVLSSLAGFEALLRGSDVTTHGVPFYAGWGLTRDLGATPARRKRRLNINALATGVLLLYPRYLDPVTALPCPPEVLVRRLIAGVRKESRFIVPLRKLQGKVNRWRFRAGSIEEV